MLPLSNKVDLNGVEKSTVPSFLLQETAHVKHVSLSLGDLCLATRDSALLCNDTEICQRTHMNFTMECVMCCEGKTIRCRFIASERRVNLEGRNKRVSLLSRSLS